MGIFNPLLLASLDRFRARLALFGDAHGMSHFEAAKDLCLLSSDIRMRLGKFGPEDKKIAARIVALFRSAKDKIRIDEPEIDKVHLGLLKEFRDNLDFRAFAIAEMACVRDEDVANAMTELSAETCSW